MLDLTPMPDLRVYALAVAVVFCLGAHSLATLIQETWLARWPYLDFWTVLLMTLSAVALASALVVEPAGLFAAPPAELLLSLAVALPLAWVAIQADRLVVRGIARGGLRRGRDGARRPPPREPEIRPLDPDRSASSLAALRGRWFAGSEAAPKSLGTLAVLLAIGALEEVLYRGYLVAFCRMIPDPAWQWAALAGTVVFFGLIHVQYGWPQVFAKIPLGALALLPVLVFDTLWPAILIHGLFNLKVWADTQGDLRTVFRSTLYPSW